MGTKSLTCVVLSGKLPIAQYGAFDGFPSRHGKNAVEFVVECKSLGRLFEFKQKVSRVRALSGEEWDIFRETESTIIKNDVESDGQVKINQANFEPNRCSFCSFDSHNQIDKCFYDQHPHLSSVVGSDILQYVMDGADYVKWDLGERGLCDWSFVVDLDRERFGIHKWAGLNLNFLKPSLRVGAAYFDNLVYEESFAELDVDSYLQRALEIEEFDYC